MTHKSCERCGLAAHETPEGMLAYNGSRLVCADCDSDLNSEWASEEPGRIHPIDTLCPAAHVAAALGR